MKKVLLVLNFTFFILHFAVSQNPLVKMWDKRFGGSSDSEILVQILETNDGGFLLGGYSFSGIGGDKTQPSQGGWDYWLVKIDSAGNKLWDKDFGGSGDDELICMQKTRDGGFVLGGNSYSPMSGDKTQPSWGFADFWILKIDSVGNKIWDKRFGGSEMEIFGSLKQTEDGGFILGGSSISGISGDKSENNWDSLGIYFDFWVIKIDSLGNKEWDRNYGGFDHEVLYSIDFSSNHSYVLCGITNSNIGGDVSFANRGQSDYWIIKIDSVGNKIWDRIYGGNFSEVFCTTTRTIDNGFLLGGFSNSYASGDKTENSHGLKDIWIVKIDSSGNKEWDKTLGGLDEEEGNDLRSLIFQTLDGGALFSGTSYSNISGDKTESNLGQEQTWVVKTNSSGIKVWDKTLHTSGHDEIGVAFQSIDGCYILGSSTAGGIAGDKTQNCQGGADYWIIKFCEILKANLTANSNLCPGTCTTFLNLSTNANSYLWSFPGASPDTSSATDPTNICYTSPGTYDVQLIASNSNGNDTLLLPNYITVYPSPPAQSITQSGDTLSAIAGAASYQWYFNSNIINGATDYFYLATQSGDYNVVATDSNGCEVEAVINDVIAAVVSGSMQSIQIYPNPVSEELIIKNEELRIGTALTISIYSILGELAVQLETRNCKPETVIVVSGLPKGMYWINISAGEKIFRAKFVKQ